METESKPPFREILWHFICSKCKLWWSFGTADEWKRKYEEVMKKDTKQLKITNNFLEMPSDQDNDN